MRALGNRDYAALWPHYKNGLLLDWSCRTCGLAYVKESPDDQREHRRNHRQVLAIYEPHSAPQVFGCGPFLEVTDASPKRVRNHLEGLARMFRRECGFDFPPYSAYEEWKNTARHFMLVDPTGRPIGGSSARLRRCEPEIDPSGSIWLMAWMFVIPSERRKGHMARTWAMMRSIIPDIMPETPFSAGSAAFFINRTDVPEWVRKAAAAVSRRALEV